MLEERPADAVDVLETALLVKRAAAAGDAAAPQELVADAAAPSEADIRRATALAGLYG